MPIYCYKCFDCEHYEEIKQNFSDEPLTECPECGGQFKRVIRNIGVIFKGSGFHITDYRDSKKSTLAPAPDKSESVSTSATSESTTKAESKPSSSSPAEG
jgi:putative FmdB family regulatory protein